MNKVIRIPSKLYFDLWNTPNIDGDKLIAVYSILKTSRNGDIKYYSYKSKNNKIVSGFSLLRAKTCLSLSVIEKYVPILIEKGLCFIDKNGDFVMLGNEKTKELYNSYKIVPVKIGKNFNETATFVVSVRIHAAKKQQDIMISKKKYRSEIIFQGNNPKSLKDLKKAKRFYKLYGNEEFTDNTILSNQGFCELKSGERDNKSKGQYWKSKLIKNGLVKSKRRFNSIQPMPYSVYRLMKKHGDFKNNYKYINGQLCEEIISSFSPINIITVEQHEYTASTTIKPKQEYKKLKHLQFDMIDFWING